MSVKLCSAVSCDQRSGPFRLARVSPPSSTGPFPLGLFALVAVRHRAAHRHCRCYCLPSLPSRLSLSRVCATLTAALPAPPPPSRLPLCGPAWDTHAPNGARRVPLRPGAGTRARRPHRTACPGSWRVPVGLPGRPHPPLCLPHRRHRRRRSATDVYWPAAARRRRRCRTPPWWQTRRVAAGGGTRL